MPGGRPCTWSRATRTSRRAGLFPWADQGGGVTSGNWGPMERNTEATAHVGGPADDIVVIGGSSAVPGLLGANSWQLRVKRGLDVILGLGVLLLLLPLLVLVALLVSMTSPGPVLFRQERIGRDGQRFRMLKFRSMHSGAEAHRSELEELNEADGPAFKIRDDPRVTTVGRYIRKLSIDELPRLWNVVRGEMSLVGPRPPLPEEVATYDWLQRRRLSVQPGLTCIWQVSGRSHTDFARWLEMDLEYIRSWSLRLDIILLLQTVPVVLSGRGAW